MMPYRDSEVPTPPTPEVYELRRGVKRLSALVVAMSMWIVFQGIVVFFVRRTPGPSQLELRRMGDSAARDHARRLGHSITGASCYVLDDLHGNGTHCTVRVVVGPDLRLRCETDGRGCFESQ